MSSKKLIANDLRIGSVVEHGGKLWDVLKREHIKPGKGGAYVQIEMKEISGETKLDIRFRSDQNVFVAHLDEEEYSFLFADKENITLMSLADCEQLVVPKKVFGEKHVFLQENIMVKLLKHGEKIVSASVPDSVVLKVVETDPYIKGQTAAASFKSAVMENGIRIMVPPFIKVGDKLVISTSDSMYVERYKEN